MEDERDLQEAEEDPGSPVDPLFRGGRRHDQRPDLSEPSRIAETRQR